MVEAAAAVMVVGGRNGGVGVAFIEHLGKLVEAPGSVIQCDCSGRWGGAGGRGVMLFRVAADELWWCLVVVVVVGFMVGKHRSGN